MFMLSRLTLVTHFRRIHESSLFCHPVRINGLAIPYLGMYLKDLVFINDGNKDGERKDELVQQVLDEIASYQVTPYPFKAHNGIQVTLQTSLDELRSARFKV